jgi:hypothetical protein
MHSMSQAEIAHVSILGAILRTIVHRACGLHTAQEVKLTDTQEYGQTSPLPSVRERWTVRRKAAVIEAVHEGCAALGEVCRLYNLSIKEFVAWERDLDRHGVPGLRTTRYQIYRDTETRRG